MSNSESPTAIRTLAILLSGLLLGGALATGLAFAIRKTIVGDAPQQALGPPGFVEESAVDGIDQAYQGDFQFFVGGGVAVFDCNSDDLPELFIAGGKSEAGLYVNDSEPGGELRFHREESSPTGLTRVTGAYPIDVDSDGITDLAVLRVGENMMFRGAGDCVFEPANGLWGIDGGDQWTTAFSAIWEDGQTLPTVVFGNYLTSKGDRGECDHHDLVRPAGNRYSAATALSPGWCTLSILFSDWSDTGQRDLRTTNDRHYYRDGEEQLWKVAPGEDPTPYTEDEGWRPMQIWGMGIASYDLTGDGRPEVFLTSQGDNKLQTLVDDSGEPTYEDVALGLGANAHRPFTGDTNRPSTAWHDEFGDVNNDGFIDLFVTKGNVDSMPEFAMRDPNNLLLGQPDGRFVEGAADAGLLDYQRSRGGALADLNLDGTLDVVVVERRAPVRIWRNVGPTGNWLRVDPRQPAPNVHAVGGWVEIRLGNSILKREITVGGGHAGGQLVPTHFGLGEARSVDVRVVWPDGEEDGWKRFAANQTVAIVRRR